MECRECDGQGLVREHQEDLAYTCPSCNNGVKEGNYIHEEEFDKLKEENENLKDILLRIVGNTELYQAIKDGQEFLKDGV